jgi:protein-S-isoprenylcysteine O-methyltransferase Ste14
MPHTSIGDNQAMENNYLILIVVFVTCLFIRMGYELLKEARKINPESKPIFAIILTVMCSLWVSWFALCPADPFQFNLPEAVRWLGFALFGIGMVIAVGALVQLRGVENIDHLVTTGLFSKIRHPMYAGFILWILGWSIYHGAIVSLAFGLFAVANILYWRRLEETRLLAEYGDTYEQYRLTTWF